MIVNAARIAHSASVDLRLIKSGQEERRTALISEFQERLGTVSKAGGKTARLAALKQIKEWRKELQSGLKSDTKERLVEFFRPSPSLWIFLLSIPIAGLVYRVLIELNFPTF
jgi:hypothetical protein